MTDRINAIDAARGLCLVNILVNHITLGVLLEGSPSKIALWDSAEVFVLLAGVSAFLAYGPRDAGGGAGGGGGWDFPAARRRMWNRALTLYVANLAVVAASFLIFLVGGAGTPPPDPAAAPPGVMAAAGGASYLWHVLTMGQSVGYSMVLRLYVVLMLVAPLYVWLAGRRFWYPLVPAAAAWLVAGHFALADRDSLTGELLAMTILPWQLVFAAGISLGAAIVQRVPVPRSRALVAAAALVVLAGTWLLVVGDRLSPDIHAWLETRNDRFWTGASKSYQSPLRLLNLAASVYLVAALPRAPVIRLLHRVRPDNMLCRLGRRSLDVFAFGAVFALAVDQLLWNLIAAGMTAPGAAAAVMTELALVALGLWLMLWIADRGRPGEAPAALQRA